MDRWACVNVFALPLQLLLRRRPEWKERPVAVVEQDKPQGLVTWLNSHARGRRLRTGMRYAEALSLVPDLQADVVIEEELAHAVEALADCLQRYSPGVEPCLEEPGIFWLNASGLLRIYPSLEDWAQEIKATLNAALGMYATVVVGFSRFGTFTVARAYRKTGVFELPEHETRAAQAVPLRLLATPDFAIESFERLGVGTIGEFLKLPSAGIRKRFGEPAYRLFRLAAGELEQPLKPYRGVEPTHEVRVLDGAEESTTRLLFLVKGLVHPLCTALDARGEKVVELCLRFILDHAPALEESVRPAEPTLDEGILLELVRLRLEAIVFTAGVLEIHATAHGTRTSVDQLGLFIQETDRDFAAANRALARLRAEFGEEAVVHLRLRDAHLPEARFEWVPLTELKAAKPVPPVTGSTLRPLMRRFHLNLTPTTSPSRWPAIVGPHIIRGGWWVREVHREYHFVEGYDGSLLWIFYDQHRNRWFVQGEVR